MHEGDLVLIVWHRNDLCNKRILILDDILRLPLSLDRIKLTRDELAVYRLAVDCKTPASSSPTRYPHRNRKSPGRLALDEQLAPRPHRKLSSL